MKKSSAVRGLCIMLLACGQAPAPGFNEPLLTVNGTLSALEGPPPSTMMVAIAWRASHPVDGQLLTYAANDVLPVQPVFPASFALAVHHLPTLPDGISLAYGVIVAFDDTNGNGLLDLLPPDAPAPVDHVLGVSEDGLSYSTDGMHSPDGTPSLKVIHWSASPTAPGFRILNQESSDFPIGVQLTADPWLRAAACESDPEAPLPTNGYADFTRAQDVMCSSDGLSFSYSYCYMESGCTVGGCRQHSYDLRVDPSATRQDAKTGTVSYCPASLPKDWPCTVTAPTGCP
jgi:hypothetical protein